MSVAIVPSRILTNVLPYTILFIIIVICEKTCSLIFDILYLGNIKSLPISYLYHLTYYDYFSNSCTVQCNNTFTCSFHRNILIENEKNIRAEKNRLQLIKHDFTVSDIL